LIKEFDLIVNQIYYKKKELLEGKINRMNLTENERTFLEYTVIVGSIFIFWLFISNLGIYVELFLGSQLDEYSMYQAESQERFEKQEYDNIQYLTNRIPDRVAKLENDIELLQKTMVETSRAAYDLCTGRACSPHRHPWGHTPQK